jgi:sigma-B regulation protein RsbU (phosphoserine phosphatase)
MQGSVAEVKLELVRKDGRTIPVMVNAAERAVEGRLLLHVAAFVAEERHKYERELLAQRQRAEQLLAQHESDQRELAAAQAQAVDRALFAEQMVGVVSHDLRNPLSVIRMSAELLAALGLQPAQRTAVERIARSVSRAERLIADLLDFTQARLGGGVSVAPAPVDLHAVIAEGVQEWDTAFAERAIVHQRVGEGHARADAERIVQATGNLVANAVRYGAAGTPVTVTTLGREAGGAQVQVHNHGEPIAPDVLPRLFEPMVRGPDARPAEGVGLGLYIVRAIMQAHGGTVEVTSTAAEGTTFTLTLPPP